MEDLYINFCNISKRSSHPYISEMRQLLLICPSIYLLSTRKTGHQLRSSVFHLLENHFHRESLRQKEIKYAGMLIWQSVATRLHRRAAKHLNWMPNRYVLITVSNASVIYTHRMRYNENKRLVLPPVTSSPFLSLQLHPTS